MEHSQRKRLFKGARLNMTSTIFMLGLDGLRTGPRDGFRRDWPLISSYSSKRKNVSARKMTAALY